MADDPKLPDLKKALEKVNYHLKLLPGSDPQPIGDPKKNYGLGTKDADFLELLRSLIKKTYNLNKAAPKKTPEAHNAGLAFGYAAIALAKVSANELTIKPAEAGKPAVKVQPAKPGKGGKEGTKAVPDQPAVPPKPPRLNWKVATEGFDVDMDLTPGQVAEAETIMKAIKDRIADCNLLDATFIDDLAKALGSGKYK